MNDSWRRGFVEEVPECSECKTRLSMRPDLKLRYSTCCGRSVCSNCVAELFRKKRSVQCAGCGRAGLEQSGFVELPLESYLAQRERRVREDLRRDGFAGLVSDDFPSVDEFNDLLEALEDIVYDTVHGSESERKAARDRLNALRQRERERLQRAAQRARAADDGIEGLAAPSTAAAAAAEAAPAIAVAAKGAVKPANSGAGPGPRVVAPSMPVMRLPRLLEAPRDSSAGRRLRRPVSEEERRASGFDQQAFDTRLAEEARALLFGFQDGG